MFWYRYTFCVLLAFGLSAKCYSQAGDLSVSPEQVILKPGASQAFSAQITNAPPGSTVSWTLYPSSDGNARLVISNDPIPLATVYLSDQIRTGDTYVLHAHPVGFGVNGTPDGTEIAAISVIGDESDIKFSEPNDIPFGGLPIAFASGDFNGDGVPDIVVLRDVDASHPNGDKAVTVFLGRGDGTFQPKKDTLIQHPPDIAAYGGIAIATADFNNSPYAAERSERVVE